MVPSHSVGTCTLAGRRTLFSKKVMVASGMKSIKMLQFREGLVEVLDYVDGSQSGFKCQFNPG